MEKKLNGTNSSLIIYIYMYYTALVDSTSQCLLISEILLSYRYCIEIEILISKHHYLVCRRVIYGASSHGSPMVSKSGCG